MLRDYERRLKDLGYNADEVEERLEEMEERMGAPSYTKVTYQTNLDTTEQDIVRVLQSTFGRYFFPAAMTEMAAVMVEDPDTAAGMLEDLMNLVQGVKNA